MTAEGKERDEALELKKETIEDLDLPEKKAKDVKGGVTGGCPHPERGVAAPPTLERCTA
ncbi:MAG: hypothetical protein ABR600_02515 [Actinomycetota bacterium]